MSNNNNHKKAAVQARPEPAPGDVAAGLRCVNIRTVLGVRKTCGEPAGVLWQFTITDADQAQRAMRDPALMPPTVMVPLCAKCEGDPSRIVVGIQRIPQRMIETATSLPKEPV